MASYKLENITFTYPQQEKSALTNVSFSFHQGEFVVIAGPSGCGKSTLLKMLKPEITPHGTKSGSYYYQDKELNQSNLEEVSKQIGYVFQNPDNQIVSETVRSELIFGMENYGYATEVMRIRLAEIVDLFDLNHLLDKRVEHLSGGQKQLLNLASIILLGPNVILLDEPTAQLDPIAAKEFLSFVKKLNEEFGITILLVEHRLEEAVGLADQLLIMDAGQIKYQGSPKDVLREIWSVKDYKFLPYIPSLPALFLHQTEEHVPLTIKEARRIKKVDPIEKDEFLNKDKSGSPLLKLEKLSFRYDRTEQNVLNNLDLSINEGSILTIFGSNGAGKSTFLKLLAGIYKPQVGKIFLHSKKVKMNEIRNLLGYLPQQTQLYFVRDTIGDELNAIKQELTGVDILFEDLINRLELNDLLDKHPHDCSGGELQKATLACILLKQPRILLLDEPTKGLDPLSKMELGSLLKELKQAGTTIILVSHDVEFAAKYSDECSLLFEGEIVAKTDTRSFIKNNFYYTTVLEKLKRFRGQN